MPSVFFQRHRDNCRHKSEDKLILALAHFRRMAQYWRGAPESNLVTKHITMYVVGAAIVRAELKRRAIEQEEFGTLINLG